MGMKFNPLVAAVVVMGAVMSTEMARGNERIDREAVVGRHSPVLETFDPLTPFGVGLPAADFVFTADVTGLQTFAAAHEAGQELNTMAGWAWHEFPNPQRFTLADCTAPHPHADGTRPYSPMTPPAGLSREKARRWTAAAAWLRSNPHRIGLGRLGFAKPDGRAIQPSEISGIRQRMDLWTGALHSRFIYQEKQVEVVTVPVAGPDGIEVRVESELLENRGIALELVFPGASGGWGDVSSTADPLAHRTETTGQGPGRAVFRRLLYGATYGAAVTWSGMPLECTAGPPSDPSNSHRRLFHPSGGKRLDLRLVFAPDASIAAKDPAFDAARSSCASLWQEHWNRGGMVDFNGSTDPRAKELERRIILSRQLAAIHCAGAFPPQETGNACNSWHGKFHLEMLPWHAAHFAMWGFPEITGRHLDYYHRILPRARETAASQGCRGARWPKMTDPSGRESPSDVGVFLVWQQPHPIYLAELVRRANPGVAVMKKHRAIVDATADFIASFPRRGEDGKLHLLPPLIPAQECCRPAETSDPAFELAYFRWALGVARRWRAELGDPPEPAWEAAYRDLAPLPLVGDRYATVSGPPHTKYHDHPCVLMTCGWLPPADGFDMARFGRTFDDIAAKWDWPTTWGWDAPVMALAAARLDRPNAAVNELLRDTPKNCYLANGHNYQDSRLTLYLPGNGGLLHTVAAMIAGWDGGPARPNPGFPSDGSWKIRSEGLVPVP